MSRYGAHLRHAAALERAVAEAQAQVRRLEREGCRAAGPLDLIKAFENRQLCTAHAGYLSALAYSVRSGVGSRGSSLVIDEQGARVPEDPAFRAQVLETRCSKGHGWQPWRPLPAAEFWFETAWEAFRRGAIPAQT